MANFQVQLNGDWRDYATEQDALLKRAFNRGFQNARFTMRGQEYECNFQTMTQKHISSGWVDQIRPPRDSLPKAAPKSAPLVKGIASSQTRFQVKIDGEWKDYSDAEDQMLKHAFKSGNTKTRFTARGCEYEYNFQNMQQINISTGKTSEMRPPLESRTACKKTPSIKPTLATSKASAKLAAGTRFQAKIGGMWKDYSATEDRILKQAYRAGLPHARFQVRGCEYEYDFSNMRQKNISTGKVCEIRAPINWKPPSKPLAKAGPAIFIKVPENGPGMTIMVPHPKCPDEFVTVAIPPTAKVGQTMLVPLPARAPRDASTPPPPCAPTVPFVQSHAERGSTCGGAKKAACVMAGVGGAAITGAVLGASIAEHGADATLEEIKSGLEDAGDALGDAAEDVGDWLGEAGDDIGETGDFIIDLF